MKKVLVLLVIIFSFLSYGQKKTDLQEMNLKGRVKSVRLISYDEIKSFEEEKKGKIYDSYEDTGFDDKGKIIYKKYYDSDKNLNSQWTYEYDEKGNLIEQIYNHSGENNPYYRRVYVYDDRENKIEETHYNADGNISLRESNKYDDKGNNIETALYDEENRMYAKFTHAYNDKNKPIEQTQYNIDNDVVRYSILKYDDKDELIEVHRYNPDKSFHSKVVHKYDEMGNYIEDSIYDIHGKFIGAKKKQYTYDSKGNWIKRISYKNDKLTEITEREIEYYP